MDNTLYEGYENLNSFASNGVFVKIFVNQIENFSGQNYNVFFFCNILYLLLM